MKGAFLFMLSTLFGRPGMELIRYRQRKMKMPGRYISVNGSRIYYEEKGSGRPVLYIHGNTGSHAWFRDVMELPERRTIAPDLVNFGHSDSIDVSDIDVYADFMDGFMGQLELENCLVVGHSLGGAVAMSLATRYPERVGKLLLVDSSPLKGLVTPEEYYPFIRLYLVNRPLLKKALAGMVPTLQDDKVLNLLVNEAMLMNKSSYTGNARALEKADFSAVAGKFGKPVLFVRGGLDPLITGEMAKETAEAFGGTVRTLEKVGHSLMIENPELFKEVLLGFDE